MSMPGFSTSPIMKQGRGRTGVILLHGFPYDIHSYVDVAPQLAAQGGRVIVPICVALARRDSAILQHFVSGAGRAWRRRGRADGRDRHPRAVLAGLVRVAAPPCVAAALWQTDAPGW